MVPSVRISEANGWRCRRFPHAAGIHEDAPTDSIVVGLPHGRRIGLRDQRGAGFEPGAAHGGNGAGRGGDDVGAADRGLRSSSAFTDNPGRLRLAGSARGVRDWFQIVTERMGRTATWAAIRCGASAPAPIIVRRQTGRDKCREAGMRQRRCALGWATPSIAPGAGRCPRQAAGSRRFTLGAPRVGCGATDTIFTPMKPPFCCHAGIRSNVASTSARNRVMVPGRRQHRACRLRRAPTSSRSSATG